VPVGRDVVSWPPFRLGVIRLAMAASTLTVMLPALADVPAASSASAGATPLALRPSRSLDLPDERPSSGVGLRLGGVALVAVVGAWLWKQRKPAPTPSSIPVLQILRRTSIGVRSELILVDMDGQRLLLGVTPNSIQNLYIMAPSEPVEATVSDPIAAEPPPRLLEATARRASRTDAAVRRTPRKAAPDYVEEQARGIRALAETK
jgi:flagellar protein FliO/FliZ